MPDDATGIRNIADGHLTNGHSAGDVPTADKGWYTLDGRVASSPLKKGIYINHGKKVIIR